MKNCKIITLVLYFITLSFSNAFSQVSFETNDVVKAKNVILFIADGQSIDVSTYARWYNGGKALPRDEIISGAVRTHNSTTPIADSAPAATAMASGYKSYPGFVGVLPDTATLPGAEMPYEKRHPIATIIEAARLNGISTGIIATSEIMHATPAAFTSHDVSRKDYDDLCEQQVYQGIDVILGGGYKFFTKEIRKDKEDLISEFKRLGYTIVRTPSELKKFKGDKVWGAFAEADMSYEIERDAKKEPSLAEMTEKAIEILSKNENGFFLMVEGSKVDWAAHADDPVGLVSDTLAYEKAVKVGLDFAKKDGNTIIISVTDHGNCGFTMGNMATSEGYYNIKIEDFVNPIKKAKYTSEYVAKKIEAGADIEKTMKEDYGVTDITKEEIEYLKGKKGYELHYSIGPIIAKRANIGFTSYGHTGEDIPLYSYLPGNKRITGTIDNTDIAKYIATAMGLDLNATTKRLFINENDLKKSGILSSSKGDVLTLKKGNITVELFKNKNIAKVNGKEEKLEGLVIHNDIKWYFPSEVINFFK